MRIRLGSDHAFACGSPFSVEARAADIEASPEEMYGTALSNEARAELVQNRVRGEQDPPEPLRILRVVRFVGLIPVERNRVRNFLGFGVDRDLYPSVGEHLDDLAIEH